MIYILKICFKKDNAANNTIFMKCLIRQNTISFLLFSERVPGLLKFLHRSGGANVHEYPKSFKEGRD